MLSTTWAAQHSLPLRYEALHRDGGGARSSRCATTSNTIQPKTSSAPAVPTVDKRYSGWLLLDTFCTYSSFPDPATVTIILSRYTRYSLAPVMLTTLPPLLDLPTACLPMSLRNDKSWAVGTVAGARRAFAGASTRTVVS